MNNALLYFGGILITALAVLFAVPRFVDWNSYRGVFEEEATRILGREVRVGGAVNVRLLPAPFVSFEKLRISDVGEDGGNSIIRVESFTMWLSVPPLLRGVVEAHRVELRRPILNLSANAEGSGNWRTLSLSPGTLPFVPKDVALQSVEIHDGAVIVSGPSRSELARVDNINGELNAEALEGPYKFKGHVTWDGAQRAVKISTAKLDANGDLRFKAAVDFVGSATSYLLDAKLADLKGVPTLEGDLTAKLDLGSGPGAAAAQPSPAPALTPEASNAPAPQASAATPSPPGGVTSLDLKSKVKGTALGAELSDIEVSLEAGATPQLITGQAKFGWSDKTRLDVDLSSRWLDLDRLARTSNAQMPLEAARGYFEALAAALPAEADTNAKLEFDQLTLGGQPISNVRLAASRSGGPLELKGVRADLPGGVRLDLDGVLTPGKGVPRLDGTLFVSGKSLMRFLSWGLAKQSVGSAESDGQFAIDGQFALGDGTMALTDATVDFSGTPLEGDLRLDLGERRKVSVSIEGPRIDAARFGSGLLNLANLRQLLGAGAPDTAVAATDTFDPAGGDLALDLKVAELIDGNRQLKDVDADIRLERGRLSIPRLRFATPEGLYVEADGAADNVPAHPKGALRGLVSAPTAEAARALLSLIEPDEASRGSLDRLAGLVPFRLAGSLSLKGDPSDASDLSVDGTVAGGRMVATLRLSGGRAKWLTSPLDVHATIDTPDVAFVTATLSGVELRNVTPSAGRVVIKATGIPADGLLAIGDATAPGLSLAYRGQVSFPKPDATGLYGELKVAASDARVPLALASIALPEGAAGVPLNGSVTVHRNDGVLRLDGDAMKIGESMLSGRLALTPGPDGRATMDGELTTDKASVAALLAPLLGKAEGDVASAKVPVPQPAARTPAAQAEPVAAVWPEQSFDLTQLGNLEGKLALNIAALELEPGLTVSAARIAADVSPQRIKVTTFEGTAVGGKLTSAFELAKAPAGVALDGDLKISIAAAAHDGANAASPREAAQGDTVAFNLKYAAQAFSPAALIASLTGKGELVIGDATLKGNSPTGVAAVVRAALTGQGPNGGASLAEAVKGALKDGEIKLGTLSVPVDVSDGALKLHKVQIDTPDGRSTATTVVELATMKIDTEWQIEPKLDKALTATASRAALPPITVIYTGKLSEFAALEPQVSTEQLERELVVRKMEFDVGELERLRKQDEDRAREEAARRKADEERARIEAERRKALESDQAPAPQSAAPDASQNGDATRQAPTSPDTFDTTVSGEGVPIERDVEAMSATPVVPPPAATPSPASEQRTRPRRKRPANEEWRPFQSTPF